MSQSRPSDEYICVVDRESCLILHTAAPQTNGSFAGANVIQDTGNREITTLSDLFDSGEDYVGGYVSSAGQEQVTAFAHVSNRPWILGVHRSKQALEEEVRAGQRVFAVVFLAVCGGLLPLSFAMLAMLLHRSHRKCLAAERERGLLEQRLFHSRKMEAIGELAGGVAHDFNNLLTVIQGNTELLVLNEEPDSERLQFLDQIMSGSNRAADLTRQLLSFARKGQLESIAVDIHGVPREVEQMLARSIDKDISLSLELDAKLSNVLGDSTQIQTALLNLGLNARDAMPHGGRVTFSTANMTIEATDARCKRGEISPGSFIEIVVTDTGS